MKEGCFQDLIPPSPSPPPPCPEPDLCMAMCPPWLCSLFKADRVMLVGADVPGKTCFVFLDDSKCGFVISDGKGGFRVTNVPCCKMEELVNYERCEDNVQMANGEAVRLCPPGFPLLMVIDSAGCMKTVRGPTEGSHVLAFENGQFVFKEQDDG